MGYEGATFDEYHALLCIESPGVTRWRAATNATSDGRPEFKSLVDQLEPDAPPARDAEMVANYHNIERRADVDLTKETFSPGIQGLGLDRIRSVRGWHALGGIRRLRFLDVIACNTAEEITLARPLEVTKLYTVECNSTCLATVLRLTRAQDVHFAVYGQVPASLDLLRGHTELQYLFAEAPLLREASALEQAPLRKANFVNIEVDAELHRLIAARRETLQELGIDTLKPFHPDALPPLPHTLRRLRLRAYKELAHEWIDWALDHPEVGCEFKGIGAWGVRGRCKEGAS